MKRFAVVALAASLALPVYAKDIATVNGQGITQEKFDQFISLLVTQGAQDSPQLRSQVKQEMINRLVAVQAAEKACKKTLPSNKKPNSPRKAFWCVP